MPCIFLPNGDRCCPHSTSIFPYSSEAFASELQENIEGIFPWYYIHSTNLQSYSSVTRSEMMNDV